MSRFISPFITEFAPQDSWNIYSTSKIFSTELVNVSEKQLFINDWRPLVSFIPLQETDVEEKVIALCPFCSFLPDQQFVLNLEIVLLTEMSSSCIVLWKLRSGV